MFPCAWKDYLYSCQLSSTLFFMYHARLLCIIYPAGNLLDIFQTPKHYFLCLSSLISFSSFSALVLQIKQYQQTLLNLTHWKIYSILSTTQTHWFLNETLMDINIHCYHDLFCRPFIYACSCGINFSRFRPKMDKHTKKVTIWLFRDSSLLTSQTNFKVKYFHNIGFVCKITWIHSQVSLKTHSSSHLSVLTRLTVQFMQKVAQKTLSLRKGSNYLSIYILIQ